MNKVILIGRLTRDVEVRYATNNNNMAIAQYTLAVNRPNRKNGEHEADFYVVLHLIRLPSLLKNFLQRECVWP